MDLFNNNIIIEKDKYITKFNEKTLELTKCLVTFRLGMENDNTMKVLDELGNWIMTCPITLKHTDEEKKVVLPKKTLTLKPNIGYFTAEEFNKNQVIKVTDDSFSFKLPNIYKPVEWVKSSQLIQPKK